jgi:hypothetical protein
MSAVVSACASAPQVSLQLRVRSRLAPPIVVRDWPCGVATLAIVCVNEDDETDDEGSDADDDDEDRKEIGRIPHAVMSSICRAPIHRSLTSLTLSSALDDVTPLTRLTALTRLDAHVPEDWHTIGDVGTLPRLAELNLRHVTRDARLPVACGPTDVLRALSGDLSPFAPHVRVTCYAGGSSAQYKPTQPSALIPPTAAAAGM